MALQSKIRYLLLACILGAAPMHGQMVELTRSTDMVTSGRLLDSDVEFKSTIDSAGFGIVEIRLPRVNIRAELNYPIRQLSVKSLSPSGNEELELGDEDVAAIALLQRALVSLPPNSNLERLLRTLNFLSAYPSGLVVNVTSPGRQGITTISSLCGSTGKSKTGTYDVDGKNFSETAQVGPCYSQSNECLGRCGPGCSSPPDATIQVFAQDCLNHDFCTRRTGTILGECSDEWAAASDDFLFGKDCGDLDGKWVDSYSYKWNISQAASGLVVGKTDSTKCSTRSVNGRHSGAQVTLTARLKKPKTGCCRAFTYTGKAQSCNMASGSWENECGLEGTWTLVRSGSSAQLIFLDEEGELVSPEDIN